MTSFIQKKICKTFFIIFCVFLLFLSKSFSQQYKIEQSTIPNGKWQAELSFPDRQKNIDDTLALNSLYAFESFNNQGELYVSLEKNIQDFSLFINQVRIDTSTFKSGYSYKISFSKIARNGKNTIQVGTIHTKNFNEKENNKVKIFIPYPILNKGKIEDSEIEKTVFDIISEIIQSDINHGFPGAQIAVAQNGAIIYENSWGYLNSYDSNGVPLPLEQRTKTSNETLFDLASCTKALAINCALQYLISEKKLSLETKVADILGNDFYKKTIKINYKNGSINSLTRNKKLKASLTIKDLACHTSGFPASPCYYNKNFNSTTQSRELKNQKFKNKLYSACDANEESRLKTFESICKTPLLYEPQTRVLYSDVNYMTLAFVVEKITGETLDEFCKKTFWKPLELEKITFTPLKNGFSKNDCAATELRGNTRGGTTLDFEGRTEVIQGEVHDETSFYAMGEISGHAGLFSNANNAVKLLFAINHGGYNNVKLFNKDIVDLFFSPQNENRANWAVGWYHQGDDQRSCNFAQSASRRTVGHVGWTGTMIMIDPESNLEIAYFTNKRNTPYYEENFYAFAGSYFTSANYGFVPQLIFEGLTNGTDKNRSLILLLGDMTHDKFRLVNMERTNGKPITESSHPIVQAAYSILEVFVKRAIKDGTPECLSFAHESLEWLSPERDAYEIEKIKKWLK